MPWFRHTSEDERRRREEEQQEQQLSQGAIERGDIPLQAQRRLDDLRSQEGLFFTSDLTVDEFVLARQASYRPLTQVMGSSVYHVGWQAMPGSWGLGGLGGLGGLSAFGRSQELTVVSQAMNHARALALQRMEAEARRAGADVVVGVHVHRLRYDWGRDLVEFNAIGTAARLDGAPPAEHPSLTNLSGQDFWKLLQAGYWPLGIVAASTVYYVVAGWQTQWASSGWGGWANQELGDFTQGLYDARHRAMSQVREQASDQQASGVVGMSIEQSEEEHEVELSNDRKRRDMIFTFDVVGTAIQERRSVQPPAVRAVLDLRG